jgi:hypothetical protein
LVNGKRKHSSEIRGGSIVKEAQSQPRAVDLRKKKKRDYERKVR